MSRFTQVTIAVILLALTVGPATAQQPSVLYETQLAGYYLPHARDIVVDSDGNAFLIGSAYADGVRLDVIVARLDPAGNEVWTVYIEGSEHDYATGLALDSAGDVWVTGWTDSADFPTVNAMDATLTGFRDVFLMKLAAADGAMLYSTFIGGDYADTGTAIAINDADEIFLTGTAGSTDFPTTPDAYQPDPSFPLYIFQDAFIAKLAPSGDEILYSTYFGGTQDDWADRIALDGAGNIIIAGRTAADDFPLVDAVDTVANDMFVAKLSADGSTLLFSTYLGGSGGDRMTGMTADAAGNVYLTGPTQSVDFPTTSGAFQESFVGAINGCEVPFGGTYNCDDFFLTKLSTTGGGLMWSTYLGGSTVDQPRAIAADDLGNVVVAGYTTSLDFPDGDLQELGSEIVVCKLSNDGSTLDYTHTVTSGTSNSGNGVTVGPEGNIYFTGTVGIPSNIYVSKLDGGRVAAAPDRTPDGRAAPVLAPNYPNPFNPATTISYELPMGASEQSVSLRVYDVAGNLVRTLVDGRQAGGRHDTTWHGRDDSGVSVSAGVYFYRLDWGDRALTGRMVMIK